MSMDQELTCELCRGRFMGERGGSNICGSCNETIYSAASDLNDEAMAANLNAALNVGAKYFAFFHLNRRCGIIPSLQDIARAKQDFIKEVDAKRREIGRT